MKKLEFQVTLKIYSYFACYTGRNIFYLTSKIHQSRGCRGYSKVIVNTLSNLIWLTYYNYQEYLKYDSVGFELLRNKYLNKYREDVSIMNFLLATLDKEFN
jgi:hypothetical protein